jgi:hypothetical protein
MWWLGYNMSVAVAVGFIALAGVAAETGVVMLIYLDQALNEGRGHCDHDGCTLTRRDVRAAVMAGAVERVRPKMMTVIAIMAGLLPILWLAAAAVEGHIRCPLQIMDRTPMSGASGRSGRQQSGLTKGKTDVCVAFIAPHCKQGEYCGGT